jgi:hypothetical protein
VLWGGNGWFAVEFWTPASAEILLERSLHQLSIGAKITGWFLLENNTIKNFKGLK